MTRLLTACLLMTSALLYWNGAIAENRTADAIQSAMYYNADIRDAEECSMEVRDGQLIAVSKDGKMISNPAMTCPDMFSWKLFADVVKDRFWSNWADEKQNWPAKPYPLCTVGEDGDCCIPGSNNDKAGHCPYFPGDAHKDRLKALSNAIGTEAEKLVNAKEILRIGRIPFVDHMNTRQSLKKDNLSFFKSSSVASQDSTPSCSAVVVDGTETNLIPQILKNFNPSGSESIGRVIRQTNAEVTVRNKPFHDYLYYNDLYNANGVAKIYKRNATNLAQDCEIDGESNVCSNAPYHLPNTSYSNGNVPRLASVDLPFEAIMIKSNWLHEDLTDALKLKSSDKDYISKYLATQISLKDLNITYDKDENPDGQCNLKGIHYLVAFHVSSKDIPNWVWTTFEHKDLPGRCDYTGCNDSFGYKSSDDLPEGVAANYVAPNERSDNLNSPSMVFAIDQGYPEEEPTDTLASIFESMNIGTGDSTSPYEPDPEDSAWLNYRLKGSQVEFVTSTGRPTILGNSVTEAGFMDGSSCITCHARAGVYVSEKDEVDFFRLSVFMRSISDYGYARSANGTPNPAWYNDSNNPPRLEVLQTDFIWGFLNAKPLDD